MIEGMVKERLVKIEVLTMSRGIFEQILVPDVNAEKLAALQKEAEELAVALVIDKGKDVWLIIQGAERLWRWMIGPSMMLGRLYKEYLWVGKLPQVFLGGKKARRGKRGGKRGEG